MRRKFRKASPPFRRMKFRKAVRLFATEKPSTLLYLGRPRTGQRRDANQPRGMLLLRAHRPVRSIAAATCSLPRHRQIQSPVANCFQKIKPLSVSARENHPLGPNADPGLVQAAEVYDAILTGKPYPIKAMVLFGTDPLLGHGDPLRGKAALEAVDFYMHVDTTINPSAHVRRFDSAGSNLLGARGADAVVRNGRRHAQLGAAASRRRETRCTNRDPIPKLFSIWRSGWICRNNFSMATSTRH